MNLSCGGKIKFIKSESTVFTMKLHGLLKNEAAELNILSLAMRFTVQRIS